MPKTTSSLFSNVYKSSVDTSAGSCTLPIEYYEGSLITLGYRINPELASNTLRDLPLEPMVNIGGYSLAILSVFEYRKTSIGPYNEIALGLYAKRVGTFPSKLRALLTMGNVKNAGTYVLNLPVNMANACAVGQEIWGYPKYLSSISTEFKPQQIYAKLGEEFSLSHQLKRGIPWRGVPFKTYSIRNHQIVETRVAVDYWIKFGGGRTVDLSILGDGPTASTIRTLGLDQLQPTYAFRTDSLNSILPKGKVVGKCS